MSRLQVENEGRSLTALPAHVGRKFAAAEERRERRERWTVRAVLAAIVIAGLAFLAWALRVAIGF